MVKKSRDLTEKYKSFRLATDAFYQSHTVQTLFNKFIKKGKKATSRRQLIRALTNFRFLFRRPPIYNTLLRMLKMLHSPLTLVSKRQGRIMIQVPVPVRRNKRDIINLQTFANAIRVRRERALYERLEQELLELTIRRPQSTTLRQMNVYMRQIYDERTNMEKR